MTAANAARDALHRYVAAPSTRTALTAYVRRRGLYGEADDVVQTVLCDALAVQAVPADPSDLPRFVTGIARRKVADEHRRRARRGHAEMPEIATMDRPEIADLLRRIQTDLVDAEQRRCLEWVVREHSGDALAEIALEHRLAPTTVRQRVSRLRRHLRARYAGALALALALALAGGAAAFHAVAPHPPATSPTAQRALAWTGTWRVVDASRPDVLPLGLRVAIEPNRARVQDPSGRIAIDLAVERVGDRTIVVRSGGTTWRAQMRPIDADHVEVRTANGFVTLVRIR